MLKEGRYVFTYPSLFLNLCYRTYFFSWIICRFIRSPYLCNVFFIVLDCDGELKPVEFFTDGIALTVKQRAEILMPVIMLINV